MGSTIYLFAAFSLTWGIIFIYILNMLKRQKSLENRIDTLRAILENEHASEC
jgi:CcmD family protein